MEIATNSKKMAFEDAVLFIYLYGNCTQKLFFSRIQPKEEGQGRNGKQDSQNPPFLRRFHRKYLAAKKSKNKNFV
tara:strand:- start:465 stop:689 length:225 start_codon:yes stop_codon:yes gene_type:complete